MNTPYTRQSIIALAILGLSFVVKTDALACSPPPPIYSCAEAQSKLAIQSAELGQLEDYLIAINNELKQSKDLQKCNRSAKRIGSCINRVSDQTLFSQVQMSTQPGNSCQNTTQVRVRYICPEVVVTNAFAHKVKNLEACESAAKVKVEIRLLKKSLDTALNYLESNCSGIGI